MTAETTVVRPAGPQAPGAFGRGPDLYKFAGVAALMVVGVGLLDTLLTFVPAGAAPDPGKGTALEWFAMLQRNGFLGLRGLGLFNIFNLALGVPVLLALYAAHQRTHKAAATLAVILACTGLAVYLSNNPALPMLGLSGKYAAATTEAQRSALIASGEALLARGEDFTPGAFGGFILGEVASLMFAWVMLRSGNFGKAAAYVGQVGMGAMLVFTVWATFVPVFYGVAMIFATVGGLLSLAWYVLIARRLFQLGRRGA